MKILFVGKQRKGSWKIRAEQLCEAEPEWTCSHEVDKKMIRRADVVVAVKRIPVGLREAVRDAGKPFIYDVVDAWSQPCADVDGEREALRRRIAESDAVIYACRAMRRDFPHRLGAVIYHHFRPGIERQVIKPQVLRVGYEGNPRYLGDWEPVIETHCAAVGAEFVRQVNKVSDVDVIVAVRAAPYNDPLSMTYKSNVKMANAIGSGTPFLFFPEPAYRETCPPSLQKWFFTTSHEFYTLLKELKSSTVRRTIHATLLAARPVFSIEATTVRYQAFCEEVLLDFEGRRPNKVAREGGGGGPVGGGPSEV